MAGLNKAAKIDAEKSTQESSAVSTFIQQAPLKQIATYLGITDTSLSRIRKEISEK